MWEIKKKVLIVAFICSVIGCVREVKADCIIGRLLDGGLGIGCGITLMISGAAIVLFPGTITHSRAMKSDSRFLWFCAGSAYATGLFLMVGGTKVAFEGTKKFFGLDSRT